MGRNELKANYKTFRVLWHSFYVVKDVLHEVQVEEQKIIQNEIQEINNAPQQTEEC